MIRLSPECNPFQKLRVILAYKNFKAAQGVSHIGLGVSAVNNCKVLNRIGIRTEVLPMKEALDLEKFLLVHKDVTHVIVSAPWIATDFFSKLCSTYPTIHFAMNCHSNVGFLQADTKGIEKIREGLALEAGTYNFHVAGNSKRFQRFIEDAYGSPCMYLPNLYYFDHMVNPHRPLWKGGVLRIGAFGATRALKNFLSAIGASIEVSRTLKAQTEIWVSTEREDGPDTKRIIGAGKAMLAGLASIQLKEAPWMPWPAFRKLIGEMHILLQPSYTESFNMVTADGVVEGVPSVVSDAITWAPAEWQAEVDNVFSISCAAVRMIHDPRAALNGFKALKKHNDDGMRSWIRYLMHLGRTHEEFDLYDPN